MMMVEDAAQEGPSPMSESALAQSAQLPGRADPWGDGVAVQGRPEDEKLMADRKKTGRLIIDGVQNRTSLVNQTLAAFAEIVDGAATLHPCIPPPARTPCTGSAVSPASRAGGVRVVLSLCMLLAGRARVHSPPSLLHAHPRIQI